ncbi:hypothetical protein TOPH_05896 [Tolypocladium ophioglossoides CBS 100239]|uniref:DUF3074 domain-containing protein n=1 Tax=Tolypocladium ophioglossoides (strain CBS 100239) TaxID=1163406 RepID=A0A0L0N6L6_TOLOC|nr:hypothetical protein TOPH_05896 [Tolypocladium ophioglossoides CBS 100239]
MNTQRTSKHTSIGTRHGHTSTSSTPLRTGNMAEKYGPFVRLWGVHASQLPASSATPQDLALFLTSLLQEALPFISNVPSSQSSTNSPWKPKGIKTYPHSVSPVQLFERIVPAADLAAVVKKHHPPQVDAAKARDETWVLRRSVHKDAAAAGTASWEEWVRCFKDGHAEAEQAFTPSVLSTALTQQWDCAGVEVELGGAHWEDWTLRLEASTHKLPAPLRNRVFPVVQATASARGRREFVVVQVAARDAEGTGDGTVRGAYTSVERLRETPDGVEWIMGTASDARGVLPAWVQRMAVPGQVAKDVDMFLGWIAEERKRMVSTGGGESGAGGEAAGRWQGNQSSVVVCCRLLSSRESMKSGHGIAPLNSTRREGTLAMDSTSLLRFILFFPYLRTKTLLFRRLRQFSPFPNSTLEASLYLPNASQQLQFHYCFLVAVNMASMKQRRRSVPSGTVPSGSQKGTLSDAVIVSPSSSPPSVQLPASKHPTANTRLLAQADALAKMTFELNLRAVSAQAERLEQEIGGLVARTSQDKEFRREHEQRIMDAWREILSVKACMGDVNSTQEDIKVGLDRCQREAAEFRKQLRQEMSDLKGLVDGVATQLDTLPMTAESDEELMGGVTQTQPIETRAVTRARSSAQISAQRRIECSKQPPKRRVQEAIKSTRRWHCDHKTTSLTDAEFTANYLKQQSKRDPAIAVLIQRAIQKRIQRRHRPRASSRPRSLNEFCQDVAWADVIETVEEVLLNNEDATTQALR